MERASLSDRERQVLSVLQSRGDEGFPAAEVARRSGHEPAETDALLDALARDGLVETFTPLEAAGAYFRLTPEGTDALADAGR